MARLEGLRTLRFVLIAGSAILSMSSMAATGASRVELVVANGLPGAARLQALDVGRAAPLVRMAQVVDGKTLSDVPVASTGSPRPTREAMTTESDGQPTSSAWDLPPEQIMTR